MDFIDLVLQVPIRLQEIRPAIQIEIGEDDAKGQPAAAGRANTFDERLIDKADAVSGRNVERGHFVGKVSDGDRAGAVTKWLGDIDPHCAGGLAITIKGDPRDRADFAKRSILLIVKQKVLHRIVGHDNVVVAVFVDVDEQHR